MLPFFLDYNSVPAQMCIAEIKINVSKNQNGFMKTLFPTFFFSRISALATKKRSNQKISVQESKSNPPIIGIVSTLSCPYFFFDLKS